MSEQQVSVSDVMNEFRKITNTPYIWGNPQAVRGPVPAAWRNLIPASITEMDGVLDPSLVGGDCSGGPYRAITKAGYIFPTRPGATWFYNNSQKMSVEDAIKTPGALLFLMDGSNAKHIEMKSDGPEDEVFAARTGTGVGIGQWSTIQKWGANEKGWTAAAGWFPGIKATGEVKTIDDEEDFVFYATVGAGLLALGVGGYVLYKKYKRRKTERSFY